MNKENKHLDHLFQEGIKDFAPTPNTEVWRRLENRLDRHKRKSHKTIWLAAASMALVLGVSALFLLQSLEQKSQQMAQDNTSWETLEQPAASTYSHQVIAFTIKHQERLAQPVDEGKKGKKIVTK